MKTDVALKNLELLFNYRNADVDWKMNHQKEVCDANDQLLDFIKSYSKMEKELVEKEKDVKELQKMYSESCSFHVKTVESLGKNYKKQLAEKDKQIEKMKCCTNCKHYISPVDMGDQICEMCEDYDHWELKV